MTQMSTAGSIPLKWDRSPGGLHVEGTSVQDDAETLSLVLFMPEKRLLLFIKTGN